MQTTQKLKKINQMHFKRDVMTKEILNREIWQMIYGCLVSAIY